MSWEKLAGPMHEYKISPDVVLYVTTREGNWHRFGYDSPDWWWRIDMQGEPVRMGVVDERVDDVESAFEEAKRQAEDEASSLV
jgi:hypothetical protein